MNVEKSFLAATSRRNIILSLSILLFNLHSPEILRIVAKREIRQNAAVAANHKGLRQHQIAPK